MQSYAGQGYRTRFIILKNRAFISLAIHTAYFLHMFLKVGIISPACISASRTLHRTNGVRLKADSPDEELAQVVIK